MLYEGVIGYNYNTIASETECYVDTARHVVTMNAGEALGMVSSNNVIVVFDITDNMPLVITERCSINDVSEDEAKSRLDKFNEKNKLFIGALSTTKEWIDVIVTRKNVYDAIEETM